MSHHKIEAKGLCYAYSDGTEAIREVGFLIGHGESVGLLGANGAGKSTLLLLLLGVLFPQEGGIYVADVKLTPKTAADIRPHLGMVFQNADEQLFMNTVYDDVAFGPRNMKLSPDEVERRVTEALDLLGIARLRDRPPYRLSGGEKRAAAIAGVLAMQPDVLVMDEPTSGLDPRARRKTMEQLKQFAHTKLIASHDIAMVRAVCSRALILCEGRLAADGPTAELLDDEELMGRCGLL
ncbi:MAG: energy-coupling factor ABC transporter ATP-binding protein [Oscillospiraceae bacterium]|jgi:cobalt/nickel transport system ATP-binding protein|nr:energy-coupling factor ABC transporter ATP-binding protein [Oscillospiraceae bacterium]